MSEVVVAGVGMHPWGKWGKNFVTYGVHAARAALADAGVDWRDVDLIVGGETVRNGYGGYVAGVAMGMTGFLNLLWEPNRRAVEERIAGTVVVKV